MQYNLLEMVLGRSSEGIAVTNRSYKDTKYGDTLPDASLFVNSVSFPNFKFQSNAATYATTLSCHYTMQEALKFLSPFCLNSTLFRTLESPSVLSLRPG